MATGRSRGPASRPPRRPGGAAPACVHPAARPPAAAPDRGRAPGWRGRLDQRRQGPPHPPWRGAAVVVAVPRGARSRSTVARATSSQRGDIAALRDEIAAPGAATSPTLEAEQERWQRPGLRRAAGPRSGCTSSCRASVGYIVLDAEPRRRRRRPPCASRPRADAPLPWYETRVGVVQAADRRRARAPSPVTARADDLPSRVDAAPTSTPSPRQLGREPRGVAEVGAPLPVRRARRRATEPRLPDGTPFPTRSTT